MNSVHSEVIDLEITRLLEDNIVSEVKDISDHFVSNVFVRPKPNGKFRMIIDLSDMNNSVEKKHFKMQHLDVAIDMMARGCFMASKRCLLCSSHREGFPEIPVFSVERSLLQVQGHALWPHLCPSYFYQDLGAYFL